jgi:hypothetical protein
VQDLLQAQSQAHATQSESGLARFITFDGVRRIAADFLWSWNAKVAVSMDFHRATSEWNAVLRVPFSGVQRGLRLEILLMHTELNPSDEGCGCFASLCRYRGGRLGTVVALQGEH